MAHLGSNKRPPLLIQSCLASHLGMVVILQGSQICIGDGGWRVAGVRTDQFLVPVDMKKQRPPQSTQPALQGEMGVWPRDTAPSPRLVAERRGAPTWHRGGGAASSGHECGVGWPAWLPLTGAI